MSAVKTIDAYFPTASETSSTENAPAEISAPEQSATAKRNRSDDGSSSSPSPKRTIYDGEQDVFSIPDDAPFWVGMMFKSLDTVSQKVTDLSSLFEDYKTHVDATISEYKSTTDKRILDLESAVNNEKEENKKLTDSIITLEEKYEFLQNTINEHDRTIDAQEQYSRRNCALLHGVREQQNENTDDVFINAISKQLGVNVAKGDIDRSHRIGAPRSNGQHRPIIVKFARYNVRATVFREKKKFKNSGMLLTDSLTRRRISILNEARERYGKTNVWTADGEIFTKIGTKKVNVTKGPVPASENE